MKMLCVGLVLCLFCATPGVVRAADPVAVEVHYQSGVKYFKRGLYEKAIQEFEKTLAMDPQHGEAHEYLVQVRALQKAYRPAEARASEKAEIKKLYEEGRRLYRARAYEEAIEVFNKILSLKPIDDFASYYREKSEILLARKIAREKKRVERQARLEEKKVHQAARRRKKAVPASTPVKKEVTLAVTAALDDVESPVSARERRRQEKLQLTEERRQEKLRVKEEKRAEVQRRREASLRAKEERRQEKLRIKEEKRAEVQRRREAKENAKEAKRREKRARRESRQRGRQEAVVSAEERREQAEASIRDKREERQKLREDRRQIKERFLEGVKAYGRKEYKAAIAAFKDVLKAEKKSGALYTRSATRLLGKARKRLEGIGKDITI